MRHRVKTRKLHRDIDARKALIYALVKAVFENKSIKTTESKAKYVKRSIEKLVSIGKRNKPELAKKRLLLSKLRNNKNLVELVLKKSKEYIHVSGGYLSIKSLKTRIGDNSKIVKLNWVELKKEEKVVEKKAAVEKPVKKTLDKSIAKKTDKKKVIKKPVTKKKIEKVK